MWLNRRIDEELEVTIGSSTKYLANPGVYGNHSAVQITKIVVKGMTRMNDGILSQEEIDALLRGQSQLSPLSRSECGND